VALPRGNSDINACVEHLEAAIEMPMQGPRDQNRRYCKNLLGRMEKAYPDRPPVDSVKLLITIGRQTFWGKFIVDFRWLFYNYARVIQEIRANHNKNKPTGYREVIVRPNGDN